MKVHFNRKGFHSLKTSYLEENVPENTDKDQFHFPETTFHGKWKIFIEQLNGEIFVIVTTSF